MNKLPEAARALLDDARHEHDPSEEQMEAMLAGLHAKLGYAAPPLPPPAAAGVVSAKLLKLALAAAALGGVALMMFVGQREVPAVSVPAVVVGSSMSMEPPAPAPARVDQPVAVVEAAPQLPVAPAKKPAPRRAAAVSVKPAAPVGAAVEAQDAQLAGATGVGINSHSGAASPSQPTAAVAPPAVEKPQETIKLSDVVPAERAPQKPKPRALTDADELILIDRAAKLVREGDHRDALELLREHSRKFPASQLKVERQGLHVLAQCGAGQLEQGRSARAAFLRDSGNAPLAARVRRACAETDKP